MIILITGCAGFIGSNLTKALLKRGDRIIGLDNFDDYYPRSVKEKNISNFVNDINFTLIEGDIRDKNVVYEALINNDVEAIIHLAARAGVRPSIENPLLYTDVNINGTTLLLEAASKLGIKKFIFASSSSVYGNNKSVPFKESDNVDFPISPYAATKKAGELICYTFHKLYNLNISCLRFFTVYGPGQRPEMAISKFVESIIADKEISVFANGNSLRDYTFIEDIVSGIILSLDNLNGYNIFNLGGASPIKLLDLIDIIERCLLKKALIKLEPAQPGDVDQTFADCSLANSNLNYIPKTSIEQGISIFINSKGI